MAMAAHMVGEDGEVVGLDWDGRTVDRVQQALLTHPALCDRVRVVGQLDVTVPPRDDGRAFDVIVMNGSVPKIPWPLVERLHPDGGRLLLFLQEPDTHGQSCYVLHKDHDVVRNEALSRFVFTPIFGRYGWDRVADLQTRWAAARARRAIEEE
jgi:protein-L-isoaspartate O-methyltransferase